MNLTEILQGTNVALHLLQVRLVLVLTLVLSFALFAWSMVLQTQLGAIIAAAWAVLVFLPVLYTGGRHGTVQRQHTENAGDQPARPNARAA
jgi:hypothetical protein